MLRRHAAAARNFLLMLAAAAALAACTHAEAVMTQAAPEAPGSAAKPAAVAASEPALAAAPMTREKASTDCWMKYEKEARGMSLDQRLPLVEKCTAAKLKAGH